MPKGTWALLLAAAVAACSSDKTGPSAASLEGTWNGTKVELVSVANPATKVDLISMGGTLVLTLNSGGTYTMVVTEPGQPDDTTSGTWSATDVLTMNYTKGSFAGTWQFDMTLSGNTLTLTGADGEYDFNGDSADEPAKINLTLLRAT